MYLAHSRQLINAVLSLLLRSCEVKSGLNDNYLVELKSSLYFSLCISERLLKLHKTRTLLMVM